MYHYLESKPQPILTKFVHNIKNKLFSRKNYDHNTINISQSCLAVQDYNRGFQTARSDYFHQQGKQAKIKRLFSRRSQAIQQNKRFLCQNNMADNFSDFLHQSIQKNQQRLSKNTNTKQCEKQFYQKISTIFHLRKQKLKKSLTLISNFSEHNIEESDIEYNKGDQNQVSSIRKQLPIVQQNEIQVFTQNQSPQKYKQKLNPIKNTQVTVLVSDQQQKEFTTLIPSKQFTPTANKRDNQCQKSNPFIAKSAKRVLSLDQIIKNSLQNQTIKPFPIKQTIFKTNNNSCNPQTSIKHNQSLLNEHNKYDNFEYATKNCNKNTAFNFDSKPQNMNSTSFYTPSFNNNNGNIHSNNNYDNYRNNQMNSNRNSIQKYEFTPNYKEKQINDNLAYKQAGSVNLNTSFLGVNNSFIESSQIQRQTCLALFSAPQSSNSQPQSLFGGNDGQTVKKTGHNQSNQSRRSKKKSAIRIF